MQTLGQYKIGTYTGTGSAVAIDCGFKPIWVKIWNETDGDVCWEAIQGLADGKAYQTVTSEEDYTLLEGDELEEELSVNKAVQSLLASNGITLSNHGFTAGSSLSESAKVFRYIAF